MLKLIDSVPLSLFIVLSLFLGLAPFVPEPHLVEKIRMLQNGELHKAIDIFDLIFHLTPFVLLVIKLVLIMKGKGKKSVTETES